MSIPISEPLASQTKHWQVRDFKDLRGTILLIVHITLARDTTETSVYKVYLIHTLQQETPKGL